MMSMMSLINNKNPRKVSYPISNSFYKVENGCKMNNPPTEKVKYKMENKKSVGKISFLDKILKYFEELFYI